MNSNANTELPPEVVLFREEKKTGSVRMRVIDYDANNIQNIAIENVTEAICFDATPSTTWFNIDSVQNVEIIHKICDGFNLDVRMLPDIINTESRPRLMEYDNCIFLSIKMLSYDETKNQIVDENFVLIIKKNILITFQERIGDVFDPVRNRIIKGKKTIRKSGTDYLAFSLLDIIIDNYIYVTSRVGEKIEFLDDALISAPSKNTLEEINLYKRLINYLRRDIKPCREVTINLAKLDADILSDTMDVHLRELQDNIGIANGLLDNYREMLSDQISIFHTDMSSRLNDILKFLTIFSVIFIPLTFIAGIYGTNFAYIPMLHFKYGFHLMMALNLLIVIVMILYFKRRKWF